MFLLTLNISENVTNEFSLEKEGREERRKEEREGKREGGGRETGKEGEKYLLFQLMIYKLVSYPRTYCHWKNTNPKQTSSSLSPCHILFPVLHWPFFFPFKKTQTHVNIIHKELH